MYSDMRSKADEKQKQNSQYLTEDIENNNIDDQNQQDGQDVEKFDSLKKRFKYNESRDAISRTS